MVENHLHTIFGSKWIFFQFVYITYIQLRLDPYSLNDEVR